LNRGDVGAQFLKVVGCLVDFRLVSGHDKIKTFFGANLCEFIANAR
jgi:hypothetical protein